MKLTDGARRDLQRYLDEVRTSLRGRVGVDPDDVVEGIREHVEAALSRRGADPATAEDLADILERLGSPEQWNERETAPGSRSTRGSAGGTQGTTAATPEGPWVELAPLALVATGGGLVLVELTVPLGWALVAAGAVTARLVLATSRRDPSGGSVSATLVLILWHVSAAVVVGSLLLLPAILVWSQSQIGGGLEPFLLEHTLPPGASPSPTPGDRPQGFWPLVALLAGTATGGWWITAGLVGRATSERLRHALGPASYLASRRTLGSILLIGVFLFFLSLLLLLGALG